MNESRDFIKKLFDSYKKRKKENRLYKNDDVVPKIIIENYLEIVEKPAFKHLINRYKKKYINLESKVEDNFSKEEKKGLADVYDYIQNYDFEKERFNVFITSLKIHQLLYKHFGDGKNGGELRESNTMLKDVDIDVVSPEEAKKIFNSYIPKWDYIFEKYNNGDIFGYIEDCIKLNVDLIKLQPFADGNKRTFRALMNLLLKKINIPPIYIEENERAEYKKVLIKAMKATSEEDYKELIQFYYYKICDAIITLDINNSKVENLSVVEERKIK